MATDMATNYIYSLIYFSYKPGLSEKKMRWHFSEQRWEWSDGCV